MFDGLATIRGSASTLTAVRPLLSTFRVGRAVDRHLIIDDSRVSQDHGFLRFMRDKVWVVRDLASKNGTFVNGRRIEAGSDIVLADQDVICFGSTSSSWIFTAGSPSEVVISSSGGASWRAVAPGVGLLPLPSEHEPSGSLLRRQTEWLLEAPGFESRVLADGQPFTVAGVEYRAWMSRADDPTVETDVHRVPLASAVLYLAVSQDEEQIAAELRVSAGARILPARVYLYLLVLLARHRLEDTALGISPSEAGWRYADEIAQALAVDQQSLNVQVYRARSDVEKLAFQDSSSIIERRSMTRQMRIGVPSEKLTLARL